MKVKPVKIQVGDLSWILADFIFQKLEFFLAPLA